MKLSIKAQASINKVIEKFKTGDLSPISKVARIQLDKSAPAHKWSLPNKIIAFVQAEELDCRGFRQWQQVGRHVKKGSKAVYIFRPHTIKKDD
ncbi:ArdC family protein, partial [Patescibacteria group bacterium]|nr:ArdC family protein [Patescibacteria group bacterium]